MQNADTHHYSPEMREKLVHLLAGYTDHQLAMAQQSFATKPDLYREPLELIAAEYAKPTRQAKACPRNANKYCAHPNCEEFD